MGTVQLWHARPFNVNLGEFVSKVRQASHEPSNHSAFEHRPLYVCADPFLLVAAWSGYQYSKSDILLQAQKFTESYPCINTHFAAQS